MDSQAYGMAIYRTFLETGAHMQVSDCSFDEGRRILEVLDPSTSVGGVPHPNIFIPVQRVSYMKLKYSDGHYPEFIRQKQYRMFLQASLHAEHRANRNRCLFAKFLVSDALICNDTGAVVTQLNKPSSTTAMTSATTTANLVRTRVWDRLMGRNLNASSMQSPLDQSDQRVHDAAMTAATASIAQIGGFRVPWRNVKAGSSGRIWAIEPVWFPQWWWNYAALTSEPEETCGGFLRMKGAG
jgi:hypothetical protein